MRTTSIVTTTEVAVPAPIESVTRTRAGGRLTGTAWLPSGELRLEDWIDHGRRLGAIGRASAWWIGDWLRYGNMEFGERYARASRITGYDAQTLMNMVYVASAIPPQQRVEALSWSHHAEVAALPPEERGPLLESAASNRLSVRCLRTEVRKHRLRKSRAPAATESPELETPRAEDRTEQCPHCGHQLSP
jgi:hypothetical protein